MNNYFEKLRVKLENDFVLLQNSSNKLILPQTETKQNKKFNIFSSEKKLPQNTENNKNSEIKTENKFLTPMLIRFNSNNGNKKDNLIKTNWKSEQKSVKESEKSEFLGKYLNANGLRQGSLQDVFDVLRLENPDFRIIDNKIRTLLCLIKTLVVRAVMIENGNKNKNPEIGTINLVKIILSKTKF